MSLKKSHKPQGNGHVQPNQKQFDKSVVQMMEEKKGEGPDKSHPNIQPKTTIFGDKVLIPPKQIQKKEAAESGDSNTDIEADVQLKEDSQGVTDGNSGTELSLGAEDKKSVPNEVTGGVFIMNDKEYSFSISGQSVDFRNFSLIESRLLLHDPNVEYLGESLKFSRMFKSLLDFSKTTTYIFKIHHDDSDYVRMLQFTSNYGDITVNQYNVQPPEVAESEKANEVESPKQSGENNSTGTSAESTTQDGPKTPEPTEQITEGTEITADAGGEEKSTGPYWKHDWHVDRFGNEALFIWEVGGKRYYPDANRGYAYIREKAALLPSDAGYDPRFERYKHRPQADEGSNPKLNWWIKRTPGWDDPSHVDNGTADFQDLAEFKDVEHNKKGSGFYYIAYVFDPMIYEKLEEQKKSRENKKYIGKVTNYKGFVSAEGGIILHDTPSPSDEAYQTKRANAEEFVIDQNSSITVIAEGNEENVGWVLVKNDIGEVGWIEERYISKNPILPEVESPHFQYTVKPGDKLENIIDYVYEQYPMMTGNDRRTIAMAIYIVNERNGTGAVYRDQDKYDHAKKIFQVVDAIDPWMEETRANYQSIELRAGEELMIPTPAFVQEMRKQGEIEKRPAFVDGMIEGGQLMRGFIDGTGEGFIDAIVGAAEDLWDTIVSIFTGEIFTQIGEMFATMWDLGLEGIWEMIKDWGTSTWEEVQAAWNNPNPYERGKYFGEIFGMILFEVVLAIITWGVGSAIKNSARVSKIMNLFPDWADDMLRKHPDGHKNGDVDLDAPDRNRVDGDNDKTPEKDKNNTDNDSDDDKKKDAIAKIAAAAYIKKQDDKDPSPEALHVRNQINKMPGMSLTNGKVYKLKRQADGKYKFYYNPPVYNGYTPGKPVNDDLEGFRDLRNQKINSVESEEMKNVMKQLYKDKGDNAGGKIVGDGSAMDALRNEIKTGSPTNGVWHDVKLVEQKNSLEKLINNERIVKFDPITKTRLKKSEWYKLVLSENDKQIAQSLLNDIDNVLKQIPPQGLNK